MTCVFFLKDLDEDMLFMLPCSPAPCAAYISLCHSFTAPQDGDAINQREAAVLRQLCSLFALWVVDTNLGEFRDGNTVTSQQGRDITRHISDLCRSIRPEAVALVDAFAFSDKFLNSAIGRYDGHIYPALMQWALQEPLNDSDVAASFKDVKLLVGQRPGARL